MEACNFPLHVESVHSRRGQRLACPICEIEGKEYTILNNLLDHLQLSHTEYRPQIIEEFTTYKPIGEVWVENTLSQDIDKECSVCFEIFKSGQIVIRTDCYCIYHKSCSQSWFDTKKMCPLHGSEHINTKK